MRKRHLEGETGLEDAVNIINAAPITDVGMSASRLFFGRPLRQPKLTLLLDDSSGGREENRGGRVEETDRERCYIEESFTGAEGRRQGSDAI